MRASTFSLLIAPSLVEALVPRQNPVESVASAATSGAASVGNAATSGAQSVATAATSGAQSAASDATSGAQSMTSAASSAVMPSQTGNTTTNGTTNGNQTETGNNTQPLEYGLPNNATVMLPQNLNIPQECQQHCSNFTQVATTCSQNATGDDCLAVCEPEKWRTFDMCLECLDDADVEGADDLDNQQDVLEALCLRSGVNPEGWTGTQTPNITVHFPSNMTVPQSCQQSCGNFSQVAEACTADAQGEQCMSVCEPQSFMQFHQCVKCIDKADDDDDDDKDDDENQQGAGNQTSSKKDWDFGDQEDKLELICRMNGKDPKPVSNSTANATVTIPENVTVPAKCEVMCPSFTKFASACSQNVTGDDCMKVCNPLEWRLFDLCVDCLDDEDAGDFDDEQDKIEDACRAHGHDPKFGNVTSGPNGTTGGNGTNGGGPGGAAASFASSSTTMSLAVVLGAAMAALL